MVSRKFIATGAAAATFAVAGCGEASGAGEPAPELSPKPTYEYSLSPTPTPTPSPSQANERQSSEPGAVQGEQAPMSSPEAPALGGCAVSTEIEFRELNDFYLARNVGEICVVVLNQYDQPAGSVNPGMEVRMDCQEDPNPDPNLTTIRILWEGGPGFVSMTNPESIPRDAPKC